VGDGIEDGSELILCQVYDTRPEWRGPHPGRQVIPRDPKAAEALLQPVFEVPDKEVLMCCTLGATAAGRECLHVVTQ
jgi:hypothetical protein